MEAVLASYGPNPVVPNMHTLRSWCRDEGVHLLTPQEFPELLRQIPQSPRWLFVRGEIEALQRTPWLALVGTRRPSSYGLRAAHGFARELVNNGFLLVSGLARGIDAVAHEACTRAGLPTLAVLGHGLDRVYPAENRALARGILESGGCLISEYPPGISPRPGNFPARNRIISGLSIGVVVVEAGAKSGSLITARHALDQNREVFVIPGPYWEKSFDGSHWLVQQGAKLVTQTSDIVSELAPGRFPTQALGENAASDSPTSDLRAYLRANSTATLEDLVQRVCSELPRLQSALDVGFEEGWIAQAGHQTYVYAGV